MTSKKQTSWPVPLGERDIGLGEAVREYAHNTEATPDEAAAYARVLRRMAGRPRRVPWLIAGFGMGAVAVATVAVFAFHRSSAPPVPQVASPHVLPKAAAPLVPVQPLPSQTPSVASIRLAASPSVLPAGKVELVNEASATVSVDAVVSGHARAGLTEIALDKGSIELQVAPRAPGHDFVVSAGGYRFMVVGTAFTVSQTEARIELSVSEGKVAVWRGSDRLATVGAGGQWTVPLGTVASSRPRAARSPAEPVSAMAFRDPGRMAEPEAHPSLPAASPPPGKTTSAPPPLAPAPPNPESVPQPVAKLPSDCGGLAGRHPQEAMGCYQQQAAQGGLAGEAAQYEIARLWRDAFNDPARSLAAFREQRSRFPGGVLAIEADLSIIELLPRLDRHAEALSESERFLKQHPGGERRGEIHLLRGNIYREALRDFDHAEREYAQGAESRGRTGDESRFLRAVCLETLGRTQEARKAYEAYLSQPKATHAADAKKRLERLAP
jgi:hypothetical protein